MAGRVDDFHGDDKQYIAYLEGEVKRLRRTSDDRRSQAELLLSEEPQPPSKKPKTSRPPWKRHADALVRKAPRAPEWWAALQKEGIYDVMRNGLAVAFLLGDEGTLPTTAGAGLICDGSTPGDQLGLLRHVARYARNAATRRLTASVATRLANFQLLLVLSACAVIRAVAQPSVREDHLLDIVKICLGDVSDDYCRRMLDTAVYVNRLIDLLNAHGWDGRGAELLLLWNRAPSFYYNLSRSSGESLEYLSTELNKPEFTQDVTIPPEWTPFFLPGLVLQITRKEYHVARVSHALGYKHAHLLTRSLSLVNPWRVFSGY